MLLFFFFNDTATTEIYTLSLHDALPISHLRHDQRGAGRRDHHGGLLHLPAGVPVPPARLRLGPVGTGTRSEEHTSELQSRPHLVCRLLLEKKKNYHAFTHHVNREPPMSR